MATKTITIKEEVYYKLKARQYPNESFSEELDRILGKQKNTFRDFAGMWSHFSDEEIKDMKTRIRKDRDQDNQREKEISGRM
jgi:predicted CopG family antitoxin